MTVQTGTKPWPQVRSSNASHTSAAVVIIGAGFSGMCLAIELIERYGIHNFVILEKSVGFGGTWRDNVYPGAACDVPSLLYSYSFEQRPDWSRIYPGQEELLSYLTDVAQKHNLYRYARFASEVKEAHWDDATEQWHTTVSLAPGTKEHESNPQYTITSDFLITAVGQLNVPQWPSIDGLDTFAGKTLHSARWDWSYDLRGKRVGVIGNGASAIQILPELAKVAGSVDVYQRTPSWIIPREDVRVPGAVQAALRWFPPLRWALRSYIMNRSEGFLWAPIAHPGSAASATIEGMTRKMMAAGLPGAANAELRANLTPTYPAGCKRILISDDFYKTLALPHVSLLVDPIRRVTPGGIAAGGGGEGDGDGARAATEREYDVIVCATGFKAVQFLHPMEITGAGGAALSEVWRGGAQAYRGVSVPRMPNFAIMYGPNTNLGHNSIILMIEAQSRYITRMVDAVLARRGERKAGSSAAAEAPSGGGGRSLVVKPGPHKAFDERVQAGLSTTAWAARGCRSWYKDAQTGRITTNWSGQVVEYQKLLEHIRWADYEGGPAVGRGESERVRRVLEEKFWLGDHKAAIWGTVSLTAALAWAYWSRRGRRGA